MTWQPSLFDGGTPAPDPGYAGLRRLRLDARSWVDYCPGWLAGADVAFEDLAGAAHWQQRTVTMWDNEVLEPRLTAGWAVDGSDAPPLLRLLCRILSARYAVTFDQVWVNLYRDGRDSVAWHGDRNRKVMTRPLVATVSLGARRRFLLRRRGTSAATHLLEPGFGDLVVMGGACQAEWEHAVPKTARPVGARMAVTIRHSQPAAGEQWLRAPAALR